MKRPPKRRYLVCINRCGGLGNHLLTWVWLIRMAEATGAVVLNPGFEKFRRDFPSTRSKAMAVWPEDAEVSGIMIWLLKILIRPFWLLYERFRIVYGLRLDVLKPLLRRIPFVARTFGFIAFDWVTVGMTLRLATSLITITA